MFTITMIILTFLLEGKNTMRNIVSVGRIGFFAGLVWGASNLLITYAFQTTSVANVLVIVSANPLFSAIFSIILLKESIPYRTILASLVCLGAIVLIFSGELANGTGSIVGVVSSIGASVTLGLYFVLIRLGMLTESSNG